MWLEGSLSTLPVNFLNDYNDTALIHETETV